jgi:hypothetical protein
VQVERREGGGGRREKGVERRDLKRKTRTNLKTINFKEKE